MLEDERDLVTGGVAHRFRDFPDGPAMIVVPLGTFTMGSRPGTGKPQERPERQVTIGHRFAIGVAPVTRGEFAVFVNATNHAMGYGATTLAGTTWKEDPEASWREPGFGQSDDHPVVCVSWHDAQTYIAWLKQRAGIETYRLPTEAEWEYCCRAGTTSSYSTGESIAPERANFGGNTGGTVSAFALPPNPWGLMGMHGNVWEWCEDTWHADYASDPPTDGSAWRGGNDALRVVRGGSWRGYPAYLRSAYRDADPLGFRDRDIGFRVVRAV
jgi:formylglycine-generating enzyme required for sulfatase activity